MLISAAINLRRVTAIKKTDIVKLKFRTSGHARPKYCVFNSSFAEEVKNITDETGGVINSPNFPNKYFTNITYDWYITSRRKDGGTILLVFEKFEMEGNPESEYCCRGFEIISQHVHTVNPTD